MHFPLIPKTYILNIYTSPEIAAKFGLNIFFGVACVTWIGSICARAWKKKEHFLSRPYQSKMHYTDIKDLDHIHESL